ncbi:MAG: hypothetical protein IPN19_00435 [Elusimicrobia bacterium]|nr:hypothetical protein [Elusimicrobiota bacterium]
MKPILPLKIGNGGMSLIEVFVGIFILALTALLVARANYSISRTEDLTKKKSLANQVCVQLMDEMRYLGNEGRGMHTIDDQDDGDRLNPHLFIIDSRGPDSRAHAMLLRQINVFHVPGEDRSRRVRVRVFDKRTNEVLAETIGFVRVYAEENPPVQSMDTYLIQTGETPGNMGFNVFLNPRLTTRTVRVGPSIRERGRESYQAKIMNNKGQIPFNGDFTDEPTNLAYLTAGSDNIDMFNHLVRYPPGGGTLGDSIRAWPGSPRRRPPEKPTPSLRYLLNEMAAGNPNYRHSLLINQGRILSLPPMRNNSDAAKDPQTQPGLRAVVHPENIRYDSGSEIKLRVYTYVTQPDLFPENSTTTVDVHLNRNYSNTDITVKRMVGNSSTRYQWRIAVRDVDYTYISDGGVSTRLTLLNSPLRHPANENEGSGGQGIAPNERLYGMEYIPCLVRHDSEFRDRHEDLEDSRTEFANNTARWVISIRAGATSDGALTVDTHLGEHVAIFHTPPNLSTTYVWVGTDVPLTERFQLIGDPRHMPYADVKRDEGYNWFFARIDTNDGYDRFERTRDGWEYETEFPVGNRVVQRLNFDFPRYMDIYRTALMNSNSSFLAGFSSKGELNSTPLSFVTLGNFVVGMDPLNTWTLRCPETAWVPNSNELRNVSEWAPPPSLSPENWHSNLRLVARTDNSWFCIPWLGELYPDDQFDVWRANGGNLPTGPGNFYRAPYSVFFSTMGHSDPMNFSFQVVGAGLTTFMNGGESRDKWVFNPFRSQQTASFTDQWREVEKSLFYFQGTRSDITTSPFELNASLRSEPPAINDYPRTRVELVRNFMKTSGDEPVAGIMRMWDRRDESRSAWVLVNGNNQRSETHANLSFSMNNAMSVWSSLEMGSPSLLPIDIRAQPIPLVSWVEPDDHALLDNPATIDLAWIMRWRRWDGEPYTSRYPDGFVPTNTNVTYTLLYSGDNRTTWTDIVYAQPSGTGVRAWSEGRTSPYSWNVANLPEGRYVLRVEAFRGEGDQHFAYHERRIEITRP